MPTEARTEPNTTIVVGDQVFEFGDDGTRQVTEAEVEQLNGYMLNGGSAKITFAKSKGGKS